jgi:hypothetical protein
MPEFIEKQDRPGTLESGAKEKLSKEALKELNKGAPKEINKLDDPVKVAQQLSKDGHIDAGLVMVLGHMNSEQAQKLVKDVNSELTKMDDKPTQQGKSATGLNLDYSDSTKIVDFGPDQRHTDNLLN